MKDVREAAAGGDEVSSHAPTKCMKSAIRRQLARCQSGLEEGDELGLVELPDGLARLAEVDLMLEGVIEAEEVHALATRALTGDDRTVGMALAFAKVDASSADGVLEDDVAVPSDGGGVQVRLTRWLQR